MMKTSTSVLSEQDFGLGPGESWKGFVQLKLLRRAGACGGMDVVALLGPATYLPPSAWLI